MLMPSSEGQDMDRIKENDKRKVSAKWFQCSEPRSWRQDEGGLPRGERRKVPNTGKQHMRG
ncbi:hypothetical protein ILYODFUR_006721, partial [Ilyodon furcidens]